MLDFTLPDGFAYALAASALLPIVNVMMARVLPEGGVLNWPLSASILGVGCAWAAVVLFLLPAGGLLQPGILAGGALLMAAIIGHVQVFFLLSRGYTLNLVVILAGKGRVASIEELANLYGGERGLEWMFRKRLAGMHALGLIDMNDDTITLTPRIGRFAARLAIICTTLLGITKRG